MRYSECTSWSPRGPTRLDNAAPTNDGKGPNQARVHGCRRSAVRCGVLYSCMVTECERSSPRKAPKRRQQCATLANAGEQPRNRATALHGGQLWLQHMISSSIYNYVSGGAFGACLHASPTSTPGPKKCVMAPDLDDAAEARPGLGRPSAEPRGARLLDLRHKNGSLCSVIDVKSSFVCAPRCIVRIGRI